jgi:hypothetical protein
MPCFKLFMLMLGCRPKGRHTEQHDIFFGLAEKPADLIPQMLQFWPEAKGVLHVDAWREVSHVSGYRIEVTEKTDQPAIDDSIKLFFINLGGYKQNEFDEFHYKMLIAGSSKAAAVSIAKQSAFYKHTGFKGATSHIDDKYGIDVDDLYEIKDILPPSIKEKYQLVLSTATAPTEDLLHIGYFKLTAL